MEKTFGYVTYIQLNTTLWFMKESIQTRNNNFRLATHIRNALSLIAVLHDKMTFPIFLQQKRYCVSVFHINESRKTFSLYRIITVIADKN